MANEQKGNETMLRSRFCPYCGTPLENGYNCENRCEAEAEEERERIIEELEERQHQSGFYAFQDLMDMYRSER